ncbi:MAG: hypothetical protein F6J94_10615 [Moorea sp. SIO1F2]|uniref:hypothetical protein n=1 Tax=unclassified Moorena TaxID=2683338 RepID=UPI0013BA34D8|nr:MULTISPECIES: hypothetical protein [unclassified Moorena]NEN97704.1 hypothetical protein [Moorena sp. SIO3I7]NEO04986.1 hypothetical protein [Moorena sp. SIO3I8]NEO21915.1 hypothetical protein [Moorena sp. SIO4A5]NEP24541.1 hypothetical protein [Moorena sp. SIO3I6]NEQ56910.1 hypothetical protein [Moorena sp. SIO4A1]
MGRWAEEKVVRLTATWYQPQMKWARCPFYKTIQIIPLLSKAKKRSRLRRLPTYLKSG